jgi:hypothetical protein
MSEPAGAPQTLERHARGGARVLGALLAGVPLGAILDGMHADGRSVEIVVSWIGRRLGLGLVTEIAPALGAQRTADE